MKHSQTGLISLLCSIFLANQGAGEASGEGTDFAWVRSVDLFELFPLHLLDVALFNLKVTASGPCILNIEYVRRSDSQYGKLWNNLDINHGKERFSEL